MHIRIKYNISIFLEFIIKQNSRTTKIHIFQLKFINFISYYTHIHNTHSRIYYNVFISFLLLSFGDILCNRIQRFFSVTSRNYLCLSYFANSGWYDCFSVCLYVCQSVYLYTACQNLYV